LQWLCHDDSTINIIWVIIIIIIIIRLELIRGESWNYSMLQKKGLHAFGSAESEPIWIKSGTM